jgi:hypothetical protein
VAERSKARVCARLPAEIAGSKPAEGLNVCVVSCEERHKAKYRTKRQRTKNDVEIKREFKKFRWGRDFPHPSVPALGLTQPPVMGTRSFRDVKRWEAASTAHPHLALRLKKE